MVLDGIAGLRLALTGNFKETRIIVKAHLHFYRDLGKWLQRRKENKKMIVRRNEEGIYPRSIVWDYFLLRKKKFTDLGWKPKSLTPKP
jgi:hypothetical protein